MPRLGQILIAIPLLIAAGLLLNTVSADSAGKHIVQLTIEGAIGPATDDYIERALEAAALQQVELVVIKMDTPGGLDTAMRGIIKNITNSAMPVATYVAPTGARAASAGTYILYASHIAAMAPGTNVGAATPVSIGGISPPDISGKEKGEENEDSEKQATQDEEDKPVVDDSSDTMKRKTINDAVAYIRGLAELHGRNQEWAEKAVREAASLPAAEALELKVIDIVASGMEDLLQQINGRDVSVQGRNRTLQTAALAIKQMDPDWRSRLLSVITNPNIAYIMMLIGIYGLILEFSNPGAIVPGTVGAISLLLALYALQLLPINYAGMGLILLGVALMIGEAFQPSFGVLGIGGTTAFIIGSIILIDTDVPGFGIDISVIVTFALISALVFIVVIGMAIKARRRPVVSGLEELIGGEAIVIDDFDDKGKVSIHSESWNALSHIPLRKGQQVKVTGIKGLVLQVEPLEASIQEKE
ncbi:MAG: nodulation protein NfeD [Gammaproteobacteria bacterium]|nr:nodulation protein NfeD [Gammaproteobacteria bacterium]